MQIYFDELFVGERNRSMGVLSSSLPDDFSRQLAHHLDLPGQPPQGYKVSSYISGTAIGNKYVIARTTTDPDAERGGMVFSHAFVFNKSSVGGIENLRPVIDKLLSRRPAQMQASKRYLHSDPAALAPAPGRFCDMITARPTSVTVLTDSDNYEDLTTRTWARLLPSMRANLQFGISFAPEESHQQGLHIALVPSVTLQRWPPDHRADTIDEAEPAQTASGRHLACTDGGQLANFVDALELTNLNLAEFSLIGHASEVLYAHSISFSGALAALRIVGRIQPSPDKGAKIKTQLMQKVFSDPGSFKPANVLALRNFNWAPFKVGPINPDTLISAFEASFKSSDAEQEKRDIVVSIFDSCTSTEEWRGAGAKAIVNLNDQAALGLAPSIWTILSSNFAIGAEVLHKAPAKLLDQALAKTAIRLQDSVSEPVRQILTDAKYYKAEATLLVLRYAGNYFTALDEVCARDPILFGTIAIESILGEMSAKDVVDAALKLDNITVEAAAAAHIALTPSLLYPHSLAERGVQTLWLKALEASDEAWRIHENPLKIQDNLFSALRSSGVEARLLNHLMGTQLGDWFEFTERADLWGLLQSPARESALAKTAEHWITSYPPSKDSQAFFSPEAQLADAIAAPVNRGLLQTALRKGNLGQALNVFLGNKKLSGSLFEEALSQMYRTGFRFSQDEAKLAGRLGICQ